MLKKCALLRPWQASQHISSVNIKSLDTAVEDAFAFFIYFFLCYFLYDSKRDI